MPLNERHFNGSRLLKPFIRVSSGRLTHSSHSAPRSRNRKAVEVSFEVAPACKNTTPQCIQHWNLISSHFFWPHTTLRPCFQVTFGAEAWSRINIRGLCEQRDTQDLAAEEQIWTKAMDVPRPLLLLLCALHLTCKYCLLYSVLLLLWHLCV